MGKISGKEFQAILKQQLDSNIEELRLVMKINNCARAVIFIFKCHELLRGRLFRVKC